MQKMLYKAFKDEKEDKDLENNEELTKSKL